MLYPTHAVGGMAAYAVIEHQGFSFSDPESFFFNLSIAAVAGVAPDVDHKKSRIHGQGERLSMFLGGALAGSAGISNFYDPMVSAQDAIVSLLFLIGVGCFFGSIFFKGFFSSYKHRGILHTLFFLIVVDTFFWVRTGEMYPVFSSFNLAFLAGLHSHLFFDFLTTEGIPVFWPLSNRRFSIPVTSTDDGMEYVIQGTLSIVLITALIPL